MIALARMWRLDDGTECIVSKDGELWRVDVSRHGVALRSELCEEPRVILKLTLAWRVEFKQRAAA